MGRAAAESALALSCRAPQDHDQTQGEPAGLFCFFCFGIGTSQLDQTRRLRRSCCNQVISMPKGRVGTSQSKVKKSPKSPRRWKGDQKKAEEIRPNSQLCFGACTWSQANHSRTTGVLVRKTTKKDGGNFVPIRIRQVGTHQLDQK